MSLGVNFAPQLQFIAVSLGPGGIAFAHTPTIPCTVDYLVVYIVGLGKNLCIAPVIQE